MRVRSLCCALLLSAGVPARAAAAAPRAAAAPAAAEDAALTGGAAAAGAPAASSAAPSGAPGAGGAPGTPAAASAASAQNAAPRVVDHVRALPPRVLTRRGRLELSPAVGVSANDPFFAHLAVGGIAAYYVREALALGIGAEGMLLDAETGAVATMRQALTASLAPLAAPRLLAHADVAWLPLYGKFSLFDGTIATFDLYVAVGFGVATAFGSRLPLLADVAVGQHIALNEWLALRLEVRDHLFVDRQQVANLPRSAVQSYVMVTAGLSFFVPPAADPVRP